MNEIITPEVSVVIAVKNRSQYLFEALRSLKSQIFKKWECIVVDDHSDENIQAVINKMEDARFKYFKNPGKPGISSARNYGNSQAISEWIAVADSDDINMPRRLLVSMDHIKNNPEADMIYGGVCSFEDGTYNLWAWNYTDYDRDLLYTRNYIFHGTVLYKKKLVQEIKYSDEFDSAVDYDLWLSFADKKKKIISFPETVTLYRRHNDQISTDPERKQKQYDNAQQMIKNHSIYL